MGVRVGGAEGVEVAEVTAAVKKSEGTDGTSVGGLEDSRGGDWDGAAGDDGGERVDPPPRVPESCVETELERRSLVGDERWIEGVGVWLREGATSKAGGGSAPLQTQRQQVRSRGGKR